MSTERIYETNEDFKGYIERFRRKDDRPLNDILKLEGIRLIAEYYNSQNKQDI